MKFLRSIGACCRISKSVRKNCTHLELLPVELGMDRENAEKNIPYVADEKTAEKIAEYLTRVSKRYGTEWEYKEGRIVLHA